MLASAAAVMAATVFLIILFKWLCPKPKVSNAHLRGRRFRTAKEVEAFLRRHRTTDDPGLQIGNHCFPSRLACGYFAIVGATGSGKTLLQRLLLQSALPSVGRG